MPGVGWACLGCRPHAWLTVWALWPVCVGSCLPPPHPPTQVNNNLDCRDTAAIDRERGMCVHNSVKSRGTVGCPHTAGCVLCAVEVLAHPCRCVRRYDLLLERPHRNILTVYGICIDAPDGKLRLVMEYCEEGSVFDLLLRARVEVSRVWAGFLVG